MIRKLGVLTGAALFIIGFAGLLILSALVGYKDMTGKEALPYALPGLWSAIKGARMANKYERTEVTEK